MAEVADKNQADHSEETSSLAKTKYLRVFGKKIVLASVNMNSLALSGVLGTLKSTRLVDVLDDATPPLMVVP